MFADVPKELDLPQVSKPFRIVAHSRGISGGVKIEKPRELHPLPFSIFVNLGGGQQRPFCAFPAWITNHSGAATHEDHRRPACRLEVGQQHHRNQISDLKTPRRGVKPHVGRDRPLRQSVG